MKLNLPTTFDDLGIPISVTRKPMRDKLGYYDPKTGELAIKEGQLGLGELIVLIHEMMHAFEATMQAEGQIKRGINHDFIHGASFGIAVALVRCGAVKCSEQEMKQFMEHMRAE